MREIEVKARIRDLNELVRQLEAQKIRLGLELEQHDIVYGQPGIKDNEAGSIWLRIRIENQVTTYFTLKKSVRGHLDSIEHETIVSDPGEMTQIIQLLGFEKYSDLTKVRRKAKIGQIEICIDRVHDLGDYIEAEMLVSDDADSSKVENKLWKLLESVGVSRDDEELRGYDVIERANRVL